MFYFSQHDPYFLKAKHMHLQRIEDNLITVKNLKVERARLIPNLVNLPRKGVFD
jgi:hypothetical protein